MTASVRPDDFRGVFRIDAEARAVYSEAAGIASVMPHAVAVPVEADDVVALVRWAGREHAPLVPRCSGSSMAGGAIGDGVIEAACELVEQRGLGLGVERWGVFQRIGDAAEQIRREHRAAERARQHADAECEGARHGRKDLVREALGVGETLVLTHGRFGWHRVHAR